MFGTPNDSTHAGGPGNTLAMLATPKDFGMALFHLFPCSGVATDGSNVAHAVVAVYTTDGFWHVAGDLAETVMSDPIAYDYLRTLPAIARAIDTAGRLRVMHHHGRDGECHSGPGGLFGCDRCDSDNDDDDRGDLDGIPGLPVFTADAPDVPDQGYTVPESPYAGRHRRPGRLMRALGFRA